MIEEWKAIPDHAGYQASNLGRIRSLGRRVNNNGGSRYIKPRNLSPWVAKGTGYLQLDLSGQRVSVHRVIASVWCPGHFEGAHVDHINGVRSDNRACNLEWVTAAENSKRSYANGRANPCKGKTSSRHPTAKAVVSTCKRSGEVRVWKSAMDAVRAGYSSDGISRCCNGKIKSHKGKVWRFAEPNPYEGQAA